MAPAWISCVENEMKKLNESYKMISSENVKPSSPTPKTLQTYKLSMLDHAAPSMLMPAILFFPFSFTSQTTHELKQSLSLVLTKFYPLAGRITSNKNGIDCNDEGVPFVVAKFIGQDLISLLKNPDMNSLGNFLPWKISSDSEQSPDSSVVQIQVNCFDCGGVVIGVVFWHKAGDAVTLATFLNSWAMANRGCNEASIRPNFTLPSIFPCGDDALPRELRSREQLNINGDLTMRRYLFDAAAISLLKSRVPHATSSVEVVSALIWKCFMAASLAQNVSQSVLVNLVNLRRKAAPPFPSETFGNFLAMAPAASRNEEGIDMGFLIAKMRDCMSKIDDEFVNKMRGDEGLSGYHENLEVMLREIPKGADVLGISSCRGLGLASVDFGWGKPIWYARSDIVGGSECNPRFRNSVWLIETRSGDGIEAWVTLDHKYMSVFHSVEDLTALASIDQTPLHNNPIYEAITKY